MKIVKVSAVLLSIFFLIYVSYSLFRRIIFVTQSPHLNLIIISLDTVRPDHMGVYGYHKDTTPHIDTFAKKSIVFSNAYTIFPATRASFFAFFSGSKKIKGVLTGDTSENTPALPELFQKRGFHTAAFVTNSVLGEKSDYFKKRFKEFYYFYTEKSPHSYADFINEGANSLKLTGRFLKWIEQNKNKKILVWLHYTNPHYPYTPPLSSLCKIDLECHDKKYNTLVDLSEEQGWRYISPEQGELQKNAYDGEIHAADEQVGIVLQKLKDEGFYENSIIVIYADHGEGFDHGQFQHGDALYESSVRIPLIIYHPFHQKHTRTDVLIDNTDIFPSLLDLYQMQYDKRNTDGKSFFPFFMWDQTITPARRYVVMRSAIAERRGITDGIYKYMDFEGDGCPPDPNRRELYKLPIDIGELHNIRTTHPDIESRLRAALQTETPIVTHRKEDLNTCLEKDSIMEKIQSLGY